MLLLLLLLFLCYAASEPNMRSALPQSVPSASSTEAYTPGKSIHLPGSGVGTWREISLSRRGNAQSQRHETSSVSSCSGSVWTVSISIVWLIINYHFSTRNHIMSNG
ncbi:uncharacterized protein [Periplaneta americana]|uniref:uncharacterized protein n=1 Tax=Periplaneta americana TaxID=6978 RepID=UPI0037E90228